MILVRSRDAIHDERGDFFFSERHFSFGEYRDPAWTAFGALRVLNVDTFAPAGVRPMEHRENMEIVTYCAAGRFRHGDSLGGDAVLLPGDVQRVTAGSGLSVTEINDSPSEPMTFVQMWFWPEARGLQPAVARRTVTREERLDRWIMLLSPDEGSEGVLPMRADAEVWVAALTPGASLPFVLPQERGAYVYAVRGGPVEVSRGGDSPPQPLEQGDAAQITGERLVRMAAGSETELLLVKARV